MNLYTKYRSQKFSDVVGQRHVVAVLTNGLISSRIGHAYLFSGPRGTGKTTIARLLAKSLNCINRKKDCFEPCNKCQSCKEIIHSTSMDIIEIDAASNRGIDEIRALRDKIKFAASGKKFKVFIIDEVHMLTREAFNALLKTLEEPPKHVVFILATTELHKVPDTIISRTLQFDFHLHNISDIINRLNYIVQEENIKIDKGSISLIAQSAKGGLRDAISILDQVSTSAKTIDESATRKILGLSSFKALIKFLNLLCQKDSASLLDLIGKLYKDGIDFSQFIYEILEILRKILLYQYQYNQALENYTKSEQEEIVCLTKKINPKNTIKFLEKFLKVHIETKNASIVQLPLELAIMDLTMSLTDFSGKKTTINKTNSQTKSSKPVVIEKKLDSEKEKIVKNNGKKKEKNIKVEKNKKQPVNQRIKSTVKLDLEKIKKQWDNLVNQEVQDKTLQMLLKRSQVSDISDKCLYVEVEFKFYKDRLEKKKIYQQICDITQKYFSIPLSLKFSVNNSLVKKVANKPIEPLKSEDDELLSDAMEMFGE